MGETSRMHGKEVNGMALFLEPQSLEIVIRSEVDESKLE
jgi:hypothetical protein